MIKNNFVPNANCIVERTSEDIDLQAANDCRDIDGVHHCAAHRMALGVEGGGGENSSGAGLLILTGEPGGLTIALTPKSLRTLAGSLARLADKLESDAAAAAAAALDRAKAPRQ